MAILDITTKTLLKLEAAGGILTEAVPPEGITPNDPFYVWLNMLPLVDVKLVSVWYDLYKAKLALKLEITRLLESQNG